MENEEIKQIKQTLDNLTVNINNKIDELSKSIRKTVGEQKDYTEGKINENPLAYMAGAFVGGVILGYVIHKGKDYSKYSK